jgi:1,4-alpha-glucan branching enzyme
VKAKTTGGKNMKTTSSKPVELSCHAPEAQAVFVAGTFNDWLFGSEG